MFSPAPRKSSAGRRSENYGGTRTPSTPVSTTMPGRPSTGTPAPWTSRLSTIVRTPSVKKTGKASGTDHIQPVFVGEFPQQVRNAQVEWLKTLAPGTTDTSGFSGGMDRKTGICWMFFGRQVFVWSYLSGNAPQGCVCLEIPSEILSLEEDEICAKHGNGWIVSVIQWEDGMHADTESIVKHCNSVGILMCSQKSLAVAYWPDIFTANNNTPVVCFLMENEPDGGNMLLDARVASSRGLKTQWAGSISSSDTTVVNSMVASPIPGSISFECIAIVCQSNAELWRLECNSNCISYQRVRHDKEAKIAYTRSIIWRWPSIVSKEKRAEFFLLTDHEIQCWNVELRPKGDVSKLWSYEILSTGDAEIKKDLAGQKRVWLLDMQVNDGGKEITVLVASFCKDRISSSSYTQYSLLTLHYKSSGQKMGEGPELTSEKLLERKAPVQVILPKARVETEDFLFSMRLRVGGKPAGSTMILSGDGTATVAHYWNQAMRLYQFDLPWDAGKVLDASIIPTVEDGEEGSWVVLTEKAGLWAIPEKAVVLGSVEPPERSLSRKGSSNEEATDGERRSLAYGGNFTFQRQGSEATETQDSREKEIPRGFSHRTAQDEETEALIWNLFQNFLKSGETEGAFEKLHQAGAFEREGEMNVFTRASKIIVDTLAKQWATSRGANIVVMAAISSQLLEKQRRHQQFLQFLAASNCHNELQKRQRQALQTIMGHGEKLAAMIHLRELHNAAAQARPLNKLESPPIESKPSEVSGSLWDLVQVVGEKTRRDNVMLMDREKAEVFYSRVSYLEELFLCVNQHLSYVIGRELPLRLQIERLCQVSIACTGLVRTAIHYRDVQHSWYPSPEGLTPWYCEPNVRAGLWKVASVLFELKTEADVSEPSMRSALIVQLEELTDVLLEAYAGALTAKIEREEEYRGLQGEYWSRRDVLLNALYQHLKDTAEAACQDANGGDQGEQRRQEILRSHSKSLIALARRHAGYQTLWDICSDLGDMNYLRSLMHESMGLKEGRFSNYVFEQCYKNHQYAKLLRLGEEFQGELATFLQKHKNILWLHEIFQNHFTSASSTLHTFALSSEDEITTSIDEPTEVCDKKAHLSLSERRRLLNLAKIAALAGGEPGLEEKVECLNADLQILKVQEEVYQMGFSGGEVLNPRQLVEICLKNDHRELVLRAFDVFAWTGNAFRRNNKSLLENAWIRVADMDNWARISQSSKEEGWSDDQNLQMLENTALFNCSNRCYGTESSLCYEGSFQEVLPLLIEDAELSNIKDADTGKWSVEAILMQHPDFPEAGQLMLTAIRAGKFIGAGLDAEDADPMSD
ncbi:hypothetical protein SUGI_0963470 [Cryptomeria japonica]|uniref:nuclear pore complex protein NUP133 n=1 Tax=Cryptomeria japonica TaxID=3369 RepID=UPI0024146B4A|nr:nuclear pore complex protein NUP133 [Cryptomeria japonica]GLJ45780.1 hypothetical protein SUGI_0963470 [Cryptomeria japonica]